VFQACPTKTFLLLDRGRVSFGRVCTGQPKTVTQQVRGPDGHVPVFIDEAGVKFLVGETLDLGKEVAEHRFFGNPEPVKVTEVPQRLARDGASYSPPAIVQLTDDVCG
jgi:hypothetical protein